MKLKDITISILIVLAVVLGSTAFLSDLSDNYDKEIDYSQINNTIKNLNKTQNIINKLNEDINIAIMREGLENFALPYDLIKLSWDSTKMLYQPLNTLMAILTDLTNILSAEIGVPSWFIQIIGGIIIISLIVIVIYALYKWKLED